MALYSFGSWQDFLNKAKSHFGYRTAEQVAAHIGGAVAEGNLPSGASLSDAWAYLEWAENPRTQARWQVGDFSETFSGEPVPQAPAQSQDYQRHKMLTAAMRFGLPREELEQMLSMARAHGQLPPMATAADESEWLTAQMSRGEAGAAFQRFKISPARWGDMPIHAANRYQGAIKIESIREKDDYGRPIIPQTHFQRKDEAHAWPMDALTHGSYLAQAPGGGIYHTWGEDPLKALKRTAQLGTHETVRMTGLQTITGGFRESEMHTAPETAMRARGAFIMGGSLGAAGMGLIDPSVGMAVQRDYRQIKPHVAKQAEWFAQPGAIFHPGTKMQLASGASPIHTGKWTYRVTDVAELESGGYGFTFERFARPEDARLRLAMGGSKAALSTQSLAGLTTPGGRSLGAQFAVEMKDPQGPVYQFYKANQQQFREDIARLRGVDVSEVDASIYNVQGHEAMQAFAKYRAGGHMQTVHWTEQMTGAAMQRFKEAGSLVSSRQIGEDLYSATTRHQALVGTFGTQWSHEYPTRGVSLGAEELEALKIARPNEYERIMAATTQQRADYTDLMNAMLSSTGKYRYPAGTSSSTDVPLHGIFSQVQAAVGTGASYHRVMDEFVKRLAGSEYGGEHIAIKTGRGKMVIPPAQVLSRFGAQPHLLEEEVSKLVSSSVELLGASIGEDEGGLNKAAAAYKRQILETTRGGSVMRGIGGATVPGGVGDVIRGSMALQPEEVYIPGIAPGPVALVRRPTQGPRSFEQIYTNVPKEIAEERGINPDEMALSPEATEANRADFDGDLGYAFAMGHFRLLPNGKVQNRLSGEVFNTATEILSAAKIAKEEGGASFWGEMSGVGKVMSLEDATQQFKGALMNPGQMSQEELRAALGQGQELYNRIAQVYTPYRGVMGRLSGAGREAMQGLFNVAYGHAQVPGELPPGMGQLHDLLNMSLAKEGRGTSSFTWSRAAQGPSPVAGGVRGHVGLMMGSTDILLGLGSKKMGGRRVSSAEFAALMSGGEKLTPGIEAATREYRRTGTPEAYGSLIKSLGGAENWLESPWGGLALSTATARSLKKGANRNELGLGRNVINRALQIKEEMQARIFAYSRHGVKTEEDLMAKAEAYRTVHPEARLVQRIDAGGQISEEEFPEWLEAQKSSPTTENRELPPEVRAHELRIRGQDPTIVSREEFAKYQARRGRAAPGSGSGARRLTSALGSLFSDMPVAAGGAGGPPIPPNPPPTAEGMMDLPEGGEPRDVGGGKGGGSSWNMFKISESEYRANLKLLSKNLERWNEAVGPAVDGTKQFTQEMKPLTQRMQTIGRTVYRGYQQDWGDAADRLTGEISMGKKLMESPAGQRLWESQAAVGQMDLDQMFGGGQMTLGERFGQAGRRLTSGWELMRLRRMWALTGGAAMGAIPVAAQAEQGALQAAMVGAPMGQMGLGAMSLGLMTTQAQQQQSQIQMGTAAQSAWGWMPQALANTGLGTAAGIVGPAAGIGLGAGVAAGWLGLAGGPIGLGVGLGATALGFANYASDVRSDDPRRALALAREVGSPLGGGWDTVFGEVGQSLRTESTLRWLGRNITGRIPGVDVDPLQPELYLSDEERRLLGMGRQMETGELGGLPMEYRTAAIQNAYQFAPQWMKQTDAQDLATQWMRYTPGAENIRGIYQDPRFEAMAARGMNPQQFVQMAGRKPEQWQEYLNLALGVSEQQFGARMATGDQWGFLKGYGMSRLDISRMAVEGMQGPLRPGETRQRLGPISGYQQALGEQLGGLAQQFRTFGMQMPAMPSSGVGIEQQFETSPLLRAQLGLAQQFAGMGAGMTAAGAGAQAAAQFGQQGIMATQGFLGGDRRIMSLLGQANVQRLGGGTGMMDMGGGLQMDADTMQEAITSSLKEVIPPDYFKDMQDMIGGLRPIIESDTGLSMGTTRMYKGFASEWMASGGRLPESVSTDLFGRYAELAEDQGIRGLQVEQRTLQQNYQNFQMRQARERLQLSGVAQFGGTFTSPYSGDTLDTRGSFAIQRELRNLGRIWEDFTQDYQNQQRELGYRQFMENWNVQAGRMPTQFQWQREDLAFQGQQQSINFGWQMEDIQEGLRFATGRDRRRLLRQQERAAITFGMGQGRLETMGERVDVREQWAQEDLERQRRQFEERYRLQDTYQDRYRQHIDERRRLEDELQQIHEFQAQFSIDAANENLDKQKELQERLRAIAEVMTSISQMNENNAAQLANVVTAVTWFVSQFNAGGQLRNSWDGFVSHIVSSLNDAQAQVSLSITDQGTNRR